MTLLRDIDLRSVVHRRLLAHAWRSPDTLVVDELGLLHGAARVDIAVINGHIRGVELKADADTLSRLPGQISAYGKVVDKATLITTERHVVGAMKLLPLWWGVVVATTSNKGVQFRRLRPERANFGVDPVALASLLWRSEVLAILTSLGCEKNFSRLSRKKLYEELALILPRRKMSEVVRAALKSRKNWRDLSLPLSCDG